MAIVSVRVERKRSGPVFLDSDGESISKVYETQTREIRIGGKDGLLLTLPGRGSIFIIDSQGVWKRRTGADLPGAIAAGMGLSLVAAIAARVIASRRLRS